MMVSRNNVNYKGDVGMSTSDLETVKILLNRIISTVNGAFVTMDINIFYLNNTLDKYEYIRIRI